MNNMQDDQQEIDIKQLLEENLRLNAETHEICLKIKKYMFMAQILGILKTLIIVIPIIIGVIYLIPLFKDFIPLFKQALPAYEEILNIKPAGVDVQSLLK